MGTHRREGIAGVGYQHAGFADSTVTDGDALDEPGRAHFHWISTPYLLTMPIPPSSSLSLRDHQENCILCEEKTNPRRFARN
jgi:hypothetical protein